LKRFISLALAALLALTAAGCAGTGKSGSESDGKLGVVATIFPAYDFAREVAGDAANITMLLPPAAESHSYEPTPQDIITIQNCGVFIYVGGDSDEWVRGVLDSMDTSRMTIVTLMDCVDVVEEEIVAGMEEEAGEEETGVPEYDEHVWTSPRNAKLIVRKLSAAFSGADAENAGVYAQNTTAYLGKLDALDAAFREVVDGAARRTIVFGDRFPFRYFTDAYGLDYAAAFPGCSTETEANPQTVAFLIDKVRDEHIPVVFHIELSNEKMANTISEETGAKVLLLHACHNVSKDDFINGESYLSLMTRNVEALREALK
jgi:zinc transport system substrate-binding protein